MAVPARTNILLEIKSALQGITTGNGYNTTVNAVSEMLLSRDEAKELGTLPVVCFGAGKDVPEHLSFQDMRVVMSLAILGYVEESDWTTRSSKLNLLIDDIITAMSADPTLNNNSVSVYFKGFETDEADPDATTGLVDGGGSCIVELEIPYYRTVNAS